ncbi:hypothetical protein CBR_g55351, partial [Chara braunii]
MGRALVVNMALFALLWYVGKVRPLGSKTRTVVKRRAAKFVWKPGGRDSEGFMPKVAWDTICHSRQEGGLGLKDPGKQNNAMVATWVPKALATDKEEHWILLAETSLMKSWKLARREDVWACIGIDSYLRRPVRSELWTGILKAWKEVKPDRWTEPVTKQEVLLQIIFENPKIRNGEGKMLMADRKAGSFGRTWIEQGIVRIRDIWNEFREDWCTTSEIKQRMVNLRRAEDKLAEVISAIPAQWKQILDPGSLDPPGTWYTDKQAQDKTQFWKLVSFEEGGGRKFELWLRGATQSSALLTRMEEEDRITRPPPVLTQ